MPSAGQPAHRSLLERHGLFLATVAALVLLSLVTEFRSLARADTGFLLDAAARVLDGAVLYRDVVEINPPLIIALNVLAVQAARGLGLSDILVYRVGFSLALLACLWLTAGMLGRILAPAEQRLRRLLVLLLAFVLFPLAAKDFGEREHLVLALLLPYLVLAAGRSMGRPAPRLAAAGVGLLAGVAFALKPHFLLVWLFLEAALRLRRRVTPWRPLPESWTIGVFLSAYLAAILVVTPQYLDLVALLAGPYTRFLYDPFWRLLVTGPGAALTLLALLASVALGRRARHPELWLTLALAMAACFLAGAAQQKGLEYHFYPSFSLAIVLLGLIVGDLHGRPSALAERMYRVVAASAVVTTAVAVLVRSGVAIAGHDPARTELEEEVRLVREHAAGGHVLVMSYHIGSAYPLINYSGVPSASRFPQLWLLPASYLDQLHAAAPLRFRAPAEMDPSERYLNQAVLADLERFRPSLLVVLRHARDLPSNGLRRLDYIAYFGRDPRFARVFERYQRIADVGEYALYQRLADGVARTGPPPSAETGTQDLLGTDVEGLHLSLLNPSFLLNLAVFASATLAFMVYPRPRKA